MLFLDFRPPGLDFRPRARFPASRARIALPGSPDDARCCQMIPDVTDDPRCCQMLPAQMPPDARCWLMLPIPTPMPIPTPTQTPIQMPTPTTIPTPIPIQISTYNKNNTHTDLGCFQRVIFWFLDFSLLQSVADCLC